MLHAQFDRLPFVGGEDRDVLAVDLDVRASEMQECCYERETSCVDEVAVVVQHVQIGSYMKALAPRYDAQALGIQRATPPDRLLQQPAQQYLALILPPNLPRRTAHGAQFATYGEDAFEFAVRVGCYDFGADVGQYAGLADADRGGAVVAGEGEVDGAEGIAGAAVEADVLAEGGEEEVLLIGGGVGFAGHVG